MVVVIELYEETGEARSRAQDVLQIDRFDTSVPVEETMKALHDLVESGKVRRLSASSMWCYQFAQM